LNNQIIPLTPIEYKLLIAMASYPGRVYSRLDLLEKIQDDGSYFEGYERSVDTHIKNLRKKIETDSRHPEFILTVFGMGYKLDRKSTRLNSSHVSISYAVFCLKKKKV